LFKLYSITGFYPADPPLDSCEVRVLDPKPCARGSFAQCWKGLFLDERVVAMKRPHSYVPSDVMKRRVERELRVWRGLDHPNILRFIGLHVDESSMCLVSPWMENGHAWDYVQKNPHKNHVRLLLQVAEGLKYLHEQGIVHGDLRGDNILISREGVACIGDFGLSRKLAEAESENSSSWHKAGNYRYMAPELLKAEMFEEAQRTMQTDIFAFGRVAYQLLAMKKPYAEISNDVSIPGVVLKGVIPTRVDDDGTTLRGLDKGMWDLMRNCWRKRPEARPNA
ncbi:hypothetical protein BOTBODRAFT_96647, partial [Botryobasidium botryosum FD-172 SS1]